MLPGKKGPGFFYYSKVIATVFTMTSSRRYKLKAISPVVYWREILAVLMLLLAIFFFRGERKELRVIIPEIQKASIYWMLVALFITALNIYFQAGMYRQSFAATGPALSWQHAISLFLKRNFLSVFLPAGGVSALAYSPMQIRKAGYTKMQVYQASGLFAFTGLLTVFIAGLPVVVFTLFRGHQAGRYWTGLLVLLLIILALFVLVRSVRQKGILYKWIDRKFPAFTPDLHTIFNTAVKPAKFTGGVLYSLGVEACGMLHVLIAMLALGLPASAGTAATVYIIAVLTTIISPFLRGLGAVELVMVYVLQQFGYSSVDALSVTIIYRVLEFWLPLAAGFIAFSWAGRHVFLRAAPCVLIFILGITNIISAITPPLHQRVNMLLEYIPLTAIHATHLLVLFTGLALLVTTAFLFRGLRNAWLIALSLSVLSMAGHLLKALDYEEAIVAAVTIAVLLITAGEYRIRGSNKWMQAGLKMCALSFMAVLLFGFISFYFIDIKHFGEDFTWRQSLLHTFKIFLLAEDTGLHPVTRFGQEFVWFIRALGFITWAFLLFTLIKPHIKTELPGETQREKAKFLLSQFGNSANDFFKVYKDKLYFFSALHEAFIAYRIAGGFAIALEEPVCSEENKVPVLQEFNRHCRQMGLKPVFYRVDENSIPWFSKLKKNSLKIGQEAILEIEKFSLEGRDKKSLRNGLNSLQKNGYAACLMTAPHPPEMLRHLRTISDEWLKSFQKKEFTFSQGMFDEAELLKQDLIVLTDSEGTVKAFLNIMPDFKEGECTYDLIRKTNDAPPAAMDALIIKLIDYASKRKIKYLNLGMVPMSGISAPANTAEYIIQMAAAKIKRFQHYRGLRSFKEKYATIWENKYLVYDNDFDLLQLPLALNNVMKP
jgi:phosphatidylglycerol lysyltransferase